MVKAEQAKPSPPKRLEQNIGPSQWGANGLLGLSHCRGRAGSWRCMRNCKTNLRRERENICLDAVLLGVQVIVAAAGGVQRSVRPAFDVASGGLPHSC